MSCFNEEAKVIEGIVTQFLRNPADGWKEEENALQKRLHAAGSAALGRLKSGRADRSRRVREDVRRKVRDKHERARAD